LWFIFYVLASLELIAEEIEDPFEAMKMIYQLIKLLRTKKHVEELL
jgi:predicted membrane chloride channel (bestrophin family)